MLKEKEKFMGQAVLHYQKMVKVRGSLGHHIDREEGKEYSYRHADLSKTKENIYVQVTSFAGLLTMKR